MVGFGPDRLGKWSCCKEVFQSTPGYAFINEILLLLKYLLLLLMAGVQKEST